MRRSECLLLTLILCCIYIVGLQLGLQAAHDASVWESYLEPWFDWTVDDDLLLPNDDHEEEAEAEEDYTPRFTAPENLKLPKPIINVGFPKAGTTTIFKFFHCNGLKAQHWYCCENQNHPGATQQKKLMSRCILDNFVANRSMFHECGDFDVYSEINGPRMFKDMDFRVLLDDGQLESKQRSRFRPRIILPQHHYLDEIHANFPNATFILNLRPVDAWVDSVLKWPTTLKQEIPNEFYQQQAHRNFSHFPDHVPKPQHKKNLGPLLRHIFEHHNDFVRDFVKRHPSHTLIEVDITNIATGQILADAFGVNETCWGHFNENKQTNKRGKGDRGKHGAIISNLMAGGGGNGRNQMKLRQMMLRQKFGSAIRGKYKAVQQQQPAPEDGGVTMDRMELEDLREQRLQRTALGKRRRGQDGIRQQRHPFNQERMAASKEDLTGIPFSNLPPNNAQGDGDGQREDLNAPLASSEE